MSTDASTDDSDGRPPGRSFRPDLDDYEAARGYLGSRGYRIGDFLQACLTWLRADPDGALSMLAPHWPTPRPRGWQAHRDHRRDQPGDPSGSAPAETQNARL
ncbi:MAG: hypothetical protein FWE35_00930 [Streptosporangiales bacterium]|nr:hypothetical protein [Streptosporangiales bacterium]